MANIYVHDDKNNPATPHNQIKSPDLIKVEDNDDNVSCTSIRSNKSHLRSSHVKDKDLIGKMVAVEM